MWAAGDFSVGILEFGGVAHDVDGHTTDRWEESHNIRSSQQLGVHATCILKQRSPQDTFLDT